MSTNVIKLVKEYYAAFNAEDHDAILKLLTADVIHDINQGSREVGKEAFSKFLDRMKNCYKESIVDIRIMSEYGDLRASAEYTVLGTYLKADEGLPQAKGQNYALPGGAFFDIRDGLIARVTNYYNLQEWLAQVT